MKMFPTYDRIECNDGATVSIQASRVTYATPRDDNGPYTHIEAGFPDVEPPASWMEYAEEANNPTGTVYGYMPTACVWEFIDAHGGLKSGTLPPFVDGRESSVGRKEQR